MANRGICVALVCALFVVVPLGASAWTRQRAYGVDLWGCDKVIAWVRSAVAGQEGDWELPAGSELPGWFKAEVADVSSQQGLRVTETGAGTIVGWQHPDGSGATMRWISDQLDKGGWVPVESGWSTCQTFVKDGGRAHWLLASCFDVDGETSVVVQAQ